MEQLVLIDGKNLAYRAHYTHRGLSCEGFPTGVLFGALQMLLSLARKLPGAAFVWVWDGPGTTWRHQLAPDTYKANRVARQESEDVRQVRVQLPRLKGFLQRAGFRQFELPGLEADDLIGVLSGLVLRRDWFPRVVVLSSDKDFYQLVGARLRVLRGQDGDRLLWVDTPEVQREYGVHGIPVSRWVEFRALTGDRSDNILPVVPGVGPKTAVQLLAAGLDLRASAPRPASSVIRGRRVRWGAHWEALRRNVQLCTVPCSSDFSGFAAATRVELRRLENRLQRESFLRDPELAGSRAAFNGAVRFLARYQMEGLLRRRAELWRLP